MVGIVRNVDVFVPGLVAWPLSIVSLANYGKVRSRFLVNKTYVNAYSNPLATCSCRYYDVCILHSMKILLICIEKSDAWITILVKADGMDALKVPRTSRGNPNGLRDDDKRQILQRWVYESVVLGLK